jgi:hypothetical protein
MCWCTPEIRTPNCGKIGCYPPRDEELVRENKIMKEALQEIKDVCESRLDSQ